VRAGRRDEGFAELRQAGAINPELLPSIIDLAWQLSHGDEQFVRTAIRPATAQTSAALANYLIKHGKFEAAAAVIADAGAALADSRRQYIEQLISAKRFAEAYRLWSIAHPPVEQVALNDGGFEQESDLDEPGFGWRAKKSEGVVLSLGNTKPREGKSSLRVEFKGPSDPGTALISQLALVQPRGHYQLQFAVRPENIVSGGLPTVVVIDAVSGQVLGKTVGLSAAGVEWHDYTIDFTVLENSPAIQIVVRREACSKTPCPIYGHLWLDAFVLRKA
jgi:hypothetical protein